MVRIIGTTGDETLFAAGTILAGLGRYTAIERGLAGYKTDAARIFETAKDAERYALRSGVGCHIYAFTRNSLEAYRKAPLSGKKAVGAITEVGAVRAASVGSERRTVLDLTWEGGFYL